MRAVGSAPCLPNRVIPVIKRASVATTPAGTRSGQRHARDAGSGSDNRARGKVSSFAMDPKVYRDMIEMQGTHWWFAVRRRLLRSWIRAHGPRRRDARILDVGAATGSNLDTLKAFGHVTALEPDPFAFRHLSGRRDIDVVQAALPTHGAEGLGDFDLIVALDVLEHIEDDVAALRSMHGMLKVGGTVIVTVPAFRFLWSTHDETMRHLRRYRAPELVDKMQQAGFSLAYRSYFNFVLFPAALAVRLSGRVFEDAASAGAGRVHPVLNAVLDRVFGAEIHVLRFLRFPFGLSIVGVGIKSA